MHRQADKGHADNLATAIFKRTVSTFVTLSQDFGTTRIILSVFQHDLLYHVRGRRSHRTLAFRLDGSCHTRISPEEGYMTAQHIAKAVDNLR